MRRLAELEDTYWHTHFACQPYYVAGRSYDQYKPAFELGWQGAMQRPGMRFEDLAPYLERQWQRKRSTSLLPWNEVASAVHDAWLHAQERMQSLQRPQPASFIVPPETIRLLRTLSRRCIQLASELRRLARMPLGDFVCEVIAHHERMLRSYSHSLAQLGTAQRLPPALGARLTHKLYRRWKAVQSRLAETEPEWLLKECEQQERLLLDAYHRALRQPSLPEPVRSLLQQQALQLREHAKKLSWARMHWRG